MKEIFIINENTGSALFYGVGTYIRETANMMLALECNVYVITLCSNNIEFEMVSDNHLIRIDIPRLNTPHNIQNYYQSVICLVELYSKNIDESLFLFNYNSHCTIAELLREKYSGVKIIYTIHYASWNVPETNVNAFVERDNLSRMIQLADGVICLSEDSRKELSDKFHIGLDKLYTIPNSMSDTYKAWTLPQKLHTKSVFYIKHCEKIILYVGRLEIMKGVNLLIRAFNSVLKDYKDIKLIIVGDGSFSEISRDIGFSASQIVFTGRIPQKEVEKWYSIADLAVMPSYSEECSFVGIEMMMHGLPIVATNGRGVRTMFHHMQNCVSVDCQRGEMVFEKELSEAMLKILNSETLANDLSKRSRQWYLDNYRFNFMKQKYLSLLEDITK